METQAKKQLLRFNILSLFYAVPDGNGGWSKPEEYGTPMKIAIESDASVKKVYGGGRIIAAIVNDKGKTFTVTTNNVSIEYEIAMLRKIRTASGTADIQQRRNIAHCIGFATQGLDDDDTMPVAKTWLYMCTTARPNESFDQNTDDINESSFDTSGEARGVRLLNADGTPYKDEKGNEVYVWQMTATPDDAGFDTFFDEVVLPIMPAPTAPEQPE